MPRHKKTNDRFAAKDSAEFSPFMIFMSSPRDSFLCLDIHSIDHLRITLYIYDEANFSPKKFQVPSEPNFSPQMSVFPPQFYSSLLLCKMWP